MQGVSGIDWYRLDGMQLDSDHAAETRVMAATENTIFKPGFDSPMRGPDKGDDP
jgi:hypothetical protein